jgi:hypothetical protein
LTAGDREYADTLNTDNWPLLLSLFTRQREVLNSNGLRFVDEWHEAVREAALTKARAKKGADLTAAEKSAVRVTRPRIRCGQYDPEAHLKAAALRLQAEKAKKGEAEPLTADEKAQLDALSSEGLTDLVNPESWMPVAYVSIPGSLTIGEILNAQWDERLVAYPRAMRNQFLTDLANDQGMVVQVPMTGTYVGAKAVDTTEQRGKSRGKGRKTYRRKTYSWDDRNLAYHTFENEQGQTTLPLLKSVEPHFQPGDQVSLGSEFAFACAPMGEGWKQLNLEKKWFELVKMWPMALLDFQFSSWMSRQSMLIDGKMCLPYHLVSTWAAAHPGQCEIVAWDIAKVEQFRDGEIDCVIPPPIWQYGFWDVDISLGDLRVVFCEDPRSQGSITQARLWAGDKHPRPSPKKPRPTQPAQPARKKQPVPAKPKRELQPASKLTGTGLPIVTETTVRDLPQAEVKSGVSRKAKASIKARVEIGAALKPGPLDTILAKPRDYPKVKVNPAAVVVTGWHKGTTNAGFFALYLPKEMLEELLVALELVMTSFTFVHDATTLFLDHEFGIMDGDGDWHDGLEFISETLAAAGG